MIPDYSKEVQGVVQQWYDAPKKDLKSDERRQLYRKTGQLIETLQELKNSGQTEKVKELSNILIQKFNDRTEGESELLAKWVAKKGAYKPLHKLFQVVADINDHPQAFKQGSAPGPLSSIINLDAAVSNYTKLKASIAPLKPKSSITSQPLVPIAKDVEKLILSNLDMKSRAVLGLTSKYQNQLFKSHVVDLLNNGEINIKDLGLNSIEEIIKYFGKENCSKIIRLDLTDVYKKQSIQDPKASKNNAMHFTEIEKVNLAKHFPNVKNFTLSNYVPWKKLNLKNLHLPKKLESLNFKQCFGIGGLSSVKDLKSLKVLDLSYNRLKDKSLDFLKEMDSLVTVNLSGNPISDPTVLMNNKKLASLNIQNTSISDLSFVKELPSLATLYFGESSFGDSAVNPLLLASANVLQECTSLTTLNILSLPIGKEFDSLKLPKLQHLACGDINNPDFLSTCKSLKSIECKFKEDLSFLENCPEITRLVLQSEFSELGGLPSLEKLEEIEFIFFYASDLSGLKNFPSLKKVIFTQCQEVSPQELENKAITVEIR